MYYKINFDYIKRVKHFPSTKKFMNFIFFSFVFVTQKLEISLGQHKW